ncbi:MAG: galactose oxidase [Ignavibacteriales bacterium]|nr:galactose oxidase [Ignavibacteriales bacterium]
MTNVKFKTPFNYLSIKAINIFIKVFLFSFLLLLTAACKEDDNDDEELIGNWKELSDFEGVPRSDAVAFTIGNKAYVGTGYDGENRLKDFWEYDPQTNNWTRKADFPGVARSGAVGFGTDTKGYIGTGYDGTNKLKDFWEYDPATNTWKQAADFEGTARYGAAAFAIDNKGYVGTGYDGNSLKDFWQYDPSTNQWTQKISLSGGKRRDAVAFVIDGKAFICTGVDNGVYENDLLEYNPAANEWTKKRSIADLSSGNYDDDYTSITGINKAAFAVNGKGYVAAGGTSSAETNVWEYDPSSDLWTQKTSLEATARVEAVGFAIGDCGYVTTGRNSNYYFDDLWGFEPGSDQVDLDKISIVEP